MDWNNLIDEARKQNAGGIEVRRGKKYTTVAVRVETLRRHAGDFGISTEIVHWGVDTGCHIVVKATVTDETGRILATGHAEEIRGKGQVNSTSALENAETSAIGRALAALGLSGGEFASINEMDGVERKADAPPFDAKGCYDRLVAGIAKRKTKQQLTEYWHNEGTALAALKEADARLYAAFRDAFAAAGEKAVDDAARQAPELVGQEPPF